MNKLLKKLDGWEGIISLLIIIFLLIGFWYDYTYLGTKLVRAQKVDYDEGNPSYIIADSAIELIRVDTSYRVGDIWKGKIFHYRIVP